MTQTKLTDLLRSHAEFVFARCEDGAAIAHDMREAAAEIGRLQAVVDRYPKTADGVSIAPEMKVWFQRSRNHGWEVAAEIVGGYYDTNKDWHCIDFDGQRCYSSQEAAEAARGEA